MLPYILTLVPVVLFVNWNNSKNFQRNLALFIWFVALVLLAGLRGDISSDFNGYRNIFRNYQRYTWKMLPAIMNISYNFNGWELGYVLLNFLISRFTDNYVWVQIIVAILTYFPVFIIAKKSDSPVIVILTFLSVGYYLEGFNTVRGMLAASICIFSIKYIEEGNFKRFLLIILIAFFFHNISILLIPLYVILRQKQSAIRMLGYSLELIILILFLGRIAYFLNGIFLFTNASNVMKMLYGHRYTFGAILPHLLVSSFAIGLYVYSRYQAKLYNINDDFLNEEDKKHVSIEIIAFNGTFIWMLLKILMTVAGYAERFASYFFPFLLILLSIELKKLNSKSKMITYPILGLCMVGWYLYSCMSICGPYKLYFS